MTTPTAIQSAEDRPGVRVDATISTEVALREALQVALGSAIPGGQEMVSMSRPLFVWLLRRSLAARTEDFIMQTNAIDQEDPSGGYKTDYYVLVRGTLRERGERVLIIREGANVTRIELKLSQFLMAFVLAGFARQEADLDGPRIHARGGVYLEPKRILTEIEKLNSSERELNERAVLTGSDLHKARWGIRNRLRAANLNPDLLESYPRAGYRLSTPPERIQIVLFDEEGTMTWGGRRKDGNGQ